MDIAEEVFKSFVTVREMLRDRGVDAASLDEVTFEDVKRLASEKTVFVIDAADGRVRLVYDLNAKLRFTDVRRVMDEAATKAAATVIVVGAEKPSAANAKLFAEAGDQVECFDMKELLYNLSRHTLVPRHEAIRAEDAIAEVLATYLLKSRHQLPLILRADPMARYLGLRPGQLVRVTRHSPAAGEYVQYRTCV